MIPHYWNRQIERWIDIFSDDEPDLTGLELVREFDNLTKKFYAVFDEDLNEIECSESYSGFESGIFREEIDITIVDSYSRVRPTMEPKSKKITKKAESVPIFARDSNRITGIEKVGQDSLDDVIVSDKNIKLVSQLPINNKKENIKVILNDDNSVMVFHLDYEGKQRMRTLSTPYDIDSETARSTYRNGILEILFDRK